MLTAEISYNYSDGYSYSYCPFRKIVHDGQMPYLYYVAMKKEIENFKVHFNYERHENANVNE
jgi:hypothetical protein